MRTRLADDPRFKRAMIWSGIAHSFLLVLIILNPELPKPAPKRNFQYIPISLIGGGGGGGGPASAVGVTELPKPNLRDLAVPSKIEPKPESKLRSPSDKPKKAPSKKAAEKKASITKPDPAAKAADKAGTPAGKPGGAAAAAGGGSGLTIGAGGPGWGEGIGGELGGQIGVFDFPYTWYLQTVRDKISTNWFTSLVDPGVRGTFQVAVYFRIYRNGSISDVEVRQSSEIPSLDLSAKRAISNASPFPPLPDDYGKEYLGIILIFEHSK
jgi:periplasmic protein TonB